MRGLLCTHAPASAHNKYTKPSSIKRQMPPFPPQNLDKVGGCGGVVQLGSRFSFWIKTQKNKECKMFSSGTEPSGGGWGSALACPPQSVHFWNKRLKMRVKNQTQHQRGPRGGGEVEWEVSPHQWDWGSRNEYPPSGMGTVGRDTQGAKTRGLCVPPPQQDGGDSGSKNGRSP